MGIDRINDFWKATPRMLFALIEMQIDKRRETQGEDLLRFFGGEGDE